MSCQFHSDRPRHCPCFSLCTHCAANHPVGCQCKKRKALADAEAQKALECKPKEEPKAVPIPSDSRIIELMELARSQNAEIMIRREQHERLQAAFEKLIEIQKQRIATAEAVKAPSQDIQTLNSVVNAIAQKPEITGIDYKTEINTLKQLVMDQPGNEEVKRQILERTEKLALLKKESLKPSRIELLAQPKIHGKPINKNAKKAK